ncbi:MAG: flagellar export protein FliJ [Enterobacterales bacterium]|nr:flagellar export protein FliJ [Enterobacterales bacterium]
MNSSQRLKPIKKLADSREKLAAQSLGKSVEARRLESERLEQLIVYRNEYLLTMAQKSEQGMLGDQLHQYHQFLTKLDAAINQQKNIVQQSEQTLDRSKKDWKDDNGRATAIDKAIKKLESKESHIKSKKESNQMDELSTQAFYGER